MDIKIALGKIEQYWQIIRNLHFHIEQEGHISQEEYALIEKYLKVITHKYKDLVLEEESTPIAIAEVGVKMKDPQPIIEEIKEKPVEIIEETISEIIKEDLIVLPVSVEEKSKLVEEPTFIELVQEEIITKEPEIPIVEEFIPEIIVEEEEVNLSTQIEELIPEIVAEAPKHHKISSYLEQMLDSPDEVPNTPMFFNVKQENTKGNSLNDKLKEMRTPVEDLNSRIKRATADKISLNDKFEFIKVLFGNNPIEYASAIQQFDTYGSMIWSNVEREFSTKFNWSSKEETVQKLKTLVTGK